MTTIRRRASRRRTRSGLRLGVLLGASLLLLLLGAVPALATVSWQITSEHGPSNMPPSGIGQYVIQAYNVGTTDTVSGYTVVDTLPSGVTATAAGGGNWVCNGIGTRTVTCNDRVVVVAPAGDATNRGNAEPLTITVSVGPVASGSNVATINGGGTATIAATSDPTTFSSDPTPFGFLPGSFQADVFDAAAPGGSPARQAGSHPFEARIGFGVKLGLFSDPEDPNHLEYTGGAGHAKTLETKLPAGLIGNPLATPQCPGAFLNAPGPGSKGDCPTDTQVGSADLVLNQGKDFQMQLDLPIYNMVPPPGTVAAFAMAVVRNPVWIIVTLDPTDHYSVIATVKNVNETFTVRSVRLALWGVPGDPAHNPLRLDTSSVAGQMGAAFRSPIKPFLTLPSTCGVPGAIEMRADSWTNPGVFTDWQQGTAATMTGCDDPRFHFDPTISVTPTQTAASTPTGLDVDLSVPQKDDTVTDARDLYPGSGSDAAIGTPPLRTAVVTLPPGMTVSPSSADGLAACTPLQIGLGTNDDPTCPDASKLGTVTLDTPLLADQLSGNIYLASQDDNPFGTTLAIYLVVRGPGVIVKLPGRVDPDPVTGQLTTTFDDNPPLPFSHLRVHFNDGPHAALVTPPTCGAQTATATLSPWNLQMPSVQTTSTFAIDGNCATGFAPSFTAGTTSTAAGKDASLITRFARSDSDQQLGGVSISMPPGLLGRISKVDLCGDAAANAGTCGDGSLIGRTTVGAGPDPDPFFITNGRVYVTGPYKGAPFGLSIVVPAIAGPFDLGTVVVRAQLQIDRRTADLRVVSDPLPTILKGIPLQVRVVEVTVDRPDFTFNPTNCAPLDATATLQSTAGATSTKSVPFQATGCKDLPFSPKLTLAVGAKHRTAAGTSTPLKAVLRMPPGQANLRGVQVVLPESLNARLNVIQRACTVAQFDAGNCEKARAGTATAVTPLLKEPLRGGVYFVRVASRGLPDMIVALRGQVDVDLDSKIRIPGSKRLSTVFGSIPDVPVTSFTLSLVAGRQGPLGTIANLCSASTRAGRVGIVFTGQNGKVVRSTPHLVIRGCTKAKAKKHVKKHKKAHKPTRGIAGAQ